MSFEPDVRYIITSSNRPFLSTFTLEAHNTVNIYTYIILYKYIHTHDKREKAAASRGSYIRQSGFHFFLAHPFLRKRMSDFLIKLSQNSCFYHVISCINKKN